MAEPLSRALRASVHVTEFGVKGDAGLVAQLARGEGGADSDHLPHVDSEVLLTDPAVPFGELRLGTHPRDPALVTVPSPAGPVSTPLIDLLKHQPHLAGSRRVLPPGDALPFVLKVLSAARPTPLRVRPGSASPRAAHVRAHLDPYALPTDDLELVVAVEPCVLLRGFAPAAVICARFGESAEVFALPGCAERLAALDAAATAEADTAAAAAAAHRGPARGGAADVVEALRDLSRAILTAPAAALEAALMQLSARVAATADGMAPRHERICAALHALHSGDGACVAAAFLLRAEELVPGDAVGISPGEPWCLLAGSALCCAPRCDDEARAGLTDQSRDIATFCALLRASPPGAALLAPARVAPHMLVFSSRARARADAGDSSSAGTRAGGSTQCSLSRCALPPGAECVLPAVDAPALVLVVSGSGAIDECAHAPFSPRVHRTAAPGLALFVPAGTDVRLAASAAARTCAAPAETASDASTWARILRGDAAGAAVAHAPLGPSGSFLAFHAVGDVLSVWS